MSYTVRKHGDFDYKTRLLGILPTHFALVNNGPWETKNLKVCKKPSQYSQGQLDVAGHPTLVGSAIAERRFGLENEVLNISTENAESQLPQASPRVVDDSASSASASSSNESLEDGNTEAPATRFVRNCFDPSKDSSPDFICERLAMISLGVEDASYVLNARKYCFTSKIDPEGTVQETIELRFMDLPVVNFGNGKEVFGGPQFVQWATKDEDTVLTSMQNMDISEKSMSKHSDSSAENEEHDDDDSNSGPYHYAFIQGELSKNLSSSPLKKFTIHMCALVGGVWNSEENPENYTCSHLAEMRTANQNTIRPVQHRTALRNAFYKRVRMQRNWFQAHLAGEKNYLVGINDVNSEKHRCIKELWLYDVEKIPRAITIAAEEEGFHPWTPDKLHHRLFSALEFINDTMKDAEPDQDFTFIHCDNTDYLYHDQDGLLLKDYILTKSKIMIRGLPRPPANLEPTEQKCFDQNQLITILKNVGYFRGEYLPSVTRVQNDIELTFNTVPLAEAFLLIVKKYWCRKEKIPPGFEKLWIERKTVDEPLDFKGTSAFLNQNRPNRFLYDSRSNHSSSYSGRTSFDNQKQHTSNFGRQAPHHTNRTRTFSDSDDNWRK